MFLSFIDNNVDTACVNIMLYILDSNNIQYKRMEINTGCSIEPGKKKLIYERNDGLYKGFDSDSSFFIFCNNYAIPSCLTMFDIGSFEYANLYPNARNFKAMSRTTDIVNSDGFPNDYSDTNQYQLWSKIFFFAKQSKLELPKKISLLFDKEFFTEALIDYKHMLIDATRKALSKSDLTGNIQIMENPDYENPSGICLPFFSVILD